MSFMNETTELSTPSSLKPYRLSVKVAIIDCHGRCLILRRSHRCKANAGRWDLPGGKVEPGESFHEALLREIAEETGLSVRLSGVLGASQSETPAARIAYLLMQAELLSGSVHLSEEHDEYIWASQEELQTTDLCPQFRLISDLLIRV